MFFSADSMQVACETNRAMNFISRLYAEYMGSMIFHFIGSVNPTPIANAVALTVMVCYTSKVSGGHLNPALTLTHCICGHINPAEMLAYWMAQFGGCIAGALMIAALIPQPNDEQVGCIATHGNIDTVQVVGWEGFATFGFIVPVMTLHWYSLNMPRFQSVGPLMVGLALYSVSLATHDWTGAIVNPARTVASEIIFRCNESHLIVYYISGQVLGAVMASCAIIPWYGIAVNPWYITPTGISCSGLEGEASPKVPQAEWGEAHPRDEGVFDDTHRTPSRGFFECPPRPLDECSRASSCKSLGDCFSMSTNAHVLDVERATVFDRKLETC